MGAVRPLLAAALACLHGRSETRWKTSTSSLSAQAPTGSSARSCSRAPDLRVHVLEDRPAVGGGCRTEFPFAAAPRLGASTGTHRLGFVPPDLLRLLGLTLPMHPRNPCHVRADDDAGRVPARGRRSRRVPRGRRAPTARDARRSRRCMPSSMRSSPTSHRRGSRARSTWRRRATATCVRHAAMRSSRSVAAASARTSIASG